jgi:hypothetical protein
MRMNEIVEDQEDRTRGFVPPEPRGLGLRWIVLVVAVVLAAVFVVTKLVPRGGGPQAAPAAQAAKQAR